jgi:hypothetical protein
MLSGLRGDFGGLPTARAGSEPSLAHAEPSVRDRESFIAQAIAVAATGTAANSFMRLAATRSVRSLLGASGNWSTSRESVKYDPSEGTGPRRSSVSAQEREPVRWRRMRSAVRARPASGGLNRPERLLDWQLQPFDLVTSPVLEAQATPLHEPVRDRRHDDVGWPSSVIVAAGFSS